MYIIPSLQAAMLLLFPTWDWEQIQTVHTPIAQETVYTIPRVSTYGLNTWETDADPCTGANMTNLCDMRAAGVRTVALSRDLLERWGGDIAYGDKVRLDASCDELDGWYQVEDTMNRRYSRTVDVLLLPSQSYTLCSGFLYHY